MKFLLLKLPIIILKSLFCEPPPPARSKNFRLKKRIFTPMLLLASLTVNAQTFDFNKQDSISNYGSGFVIGKIQTTGLTARVGNSEIDWITNGDDSVTNVIITGDTLALFQVLYESFMNNSNELRVSRTVLRSINLELLSQQNKNQYFSQIVNDYLEYKKKNP